MINKLSRRDFLKQALGAASVLSAPTIINYLGQSSSSSDKEFLEVRDGKFYMGGEEYTIKGTNYLTRDNPWRMFKEYDPEQIDEELGYAEELGINSVRVQLMHPYAVRNKHKKPIKLKEQYMDNFISFLEVADSHDMKVMPILTGFFPWGHFKPENFALAEDYFKSWVSEFEDDERILAWDIKNEPDNHEEFFKKEFGEDSEYKIEQYTKRMSQLVENLDSNHPRTIGLGDTHAPQGEVKANLIEELPKYIDNEDFYSFHFYVPLKFLDEAIDKIKTRTNKPVLLQEFGVPTTGENKHRTEDNQERYYKEILEGVSRENLEGIMFWKLTDNPDKLGNLDVRYGPVYDNNSKRDFEDDFGVLRTDYSKKPAAHVVKQYYKRIL